MAYELSAEQRKVAKRIVKIGKRRGESRKEIKAALETGLVESNLRNLPGGDADSAGWRQERASLYSNPTNVKASVNRFYDETSAVEGKYKRAGDLAAAVQRPAAQYRGRYHERKQDAEAILQDLRGGGGLVPRTSMGYAPATVKTTPGVDNGPERQALLQGYLQSRHDPEALTQLAYGLGGAQDIAPTRTVVPGQRLKQSAAQPVKGSKGPEHALSWVESKVGFTEATGSNDGGLASKLNSRFGFQNAPWCAMFTSAAVTRGGAPKEARTASVAEVRRKAQAKQGYRGFVKPEKAQPGDLLLWGDRHIGIVKSVSGGKINYIAGNESNGVNPGTADFGEVDVVRPKYGARKKRK